MLMDLMTNAFSLLEGTDM